MVIIGNTQAGQIQKCFFALCFTFLPCRAEASEGGSSSSLQFVPKSTALEFPAHANRIITRENSPHCANFTHPCVISANHKRRSAGFPCRAVAKRRRKPAATFTLQQVPDFTMSLNLLTEVFSLSNFGYTHVKFGPVAQRELKLYLPN